MASSMAVVAELNIALDTSAICPLTAPLMTAKPMSKSQTMFIP
jgi:hypothetical protein